jgi:hypothetical protein
MTTSNHWPVFSGLFLRQAATLARQYYPAAEIDRAGVRPNECAHRLVRAHGDDAIPTHRKRLCHAAGGIFSVNFPVHQHQIGRCRSGSSSQSKQRRRQNTQGVTHFPSILP